VLKNATGKNSGDIADLNYDEVCDHPVHRNAAVQQSQDYRLNDHEAQQYQQGANLEYRSGYRAGEQMEYGRVQQKFRSFTRLVRTLEVNRKCKLNMRNVGTAVFPRRIGIAQQILKLNFRAARNLSQLNPIVCNRDASSLLQCEDL
jgi:hypothetical protein